MTVADPIAVEPAALDETKAYLRVDGAIEDASIAG